MFANVVVVASLVVAMRRRTSSTTVIGLEAMAPSLHKGDDADEKPIPHWDGIDGTIGVLSFHMATSVISGTNHDFCSDLDGLPDQILQMKLSPTHIGLATTPYSMLSPS